MLRQDPLFSNLKSSVIQIPPSYEVPADIESFERLVDKRSRPQRYQFYQNTKKTLAD